MQNVGPDGEGTSHRKTQRENNFFNMHFENWLGSEWQVFCRCIISFTVFLSWLKVYRKLLFHYLSILFRATPLQVSEKWKWTDTMLSRVRLFATPWTVAHQAPPPIGFSRQEYWSGLPFPSPGDLPDPGIKPRFPALQADALTSEPPGKPSSKGKETCKTTVIRMDCQNIRDQMSTFLEHTPDVHTS